MRLVRVRVKQNISALIFGSTPPLRPGAKGFARLSRDAITTKQPWLGVPTPLQNMSTLKPTVEPTQEQLRNLYPAGLSLVLVQIVCPW